MVASLVGELSLRSENTINDESDLPITTDAEIDHSKRIDRLMYNLFSAVESGLVQEE